MPYLGKYCEVALYRHWLSFSDFKPSNTSAYLCFKNLLSLYPFFPGQNTTFNEMPHISAYLDFYPCSFVLFIMLSFYSRRFSREHVLPRSSLDHRSQTGNGKSAPWGGKVVILQGYCTSRWGWHKVVSHPPQVLCMLQTRLTWILDMKIDIYRLWVHADVYIDCLGNKDPNHNKNTERKWSRLFWWILFSYCHTEFTLGHQSVLFQDSSFFLPQPYPNICIIQNKIDILACLC